MTLLEQIQEQLRQLPPERQGEVLDFVLSLRQHRTVAPQPAKERPLRTQPAFGSWRGRKVDTLKYQQNLRSEWDECA